MVRFKNRWLLVEFIPAEASSTSLSLEGNQIWNAIRLSVLQHFGDVGWGVVGLSLTVKYYSPITNICILRVARDQHNIAWGAITLLQSIEGQKLIPNVIHVSGTIKHAQLAAVEHNREVIARFRARAKTPVNYRDSYEQYLQTSSTEIEALQD